MVNEPFNDYLDLVQAARILGIRPQTLRRLFSQKKLRTVLSGGKYLIKREDLDMFKRNQGRR